MDRQRKQTHGRAKKKGEPVALAAPKILFRAADMIACPQQAAYKKRHARKHDDSAGCSPVGQQVEVVIMRAVGPRLDVFRAILPEAIVIMGRTDAPPEIIPPHLFSRSPHAAPEIQLVLLAVQRSLDAVHVRQRLLQIIFREISSARDQNNQQQQGRNPVIPVKNQDDEQCQQRHRTRRPAAARKRQGQPDRRTQGCVAK